MTKTRMRKSHFFLLKSTLIVGFGGFLFGYDIGVISGALPQLASHFNLSSYEAGLVTAILPLGSCLGSVFGGPFCDKFGRWWTIHLQNFCFIIGSIIIATAESVPSIYIGRFVVGIAAALSPVADIPYLTEISPLSLRGRISSAYEILVVIGILCSFIVALCLSNQHKGWRMMFILPSLLAFIQSLGVFFLPESPQWLMENGQSEKAREVIGLMVDEDGEIPSRIEEIQTHCSTRLIGSMTLQSRIYFQQYLIPLVVVMILMIFQQFTGGVVIRNYSPQIFHQAGYSDRVSLIFTVFLGLVKVIVTLWAVAYVDHMGRKPLLLYGILFIGLGMIILSLSFAFNTSPSASTSRINSIFIVILFIFSSSLITVGYGIGFGPISWLLQTEFFPTILRGRVMAITVIISNLSQFLSNFMYFPLLELIGDSGVFFLFFIICLFGYIYVFLFVIETKGREPNELLLLYQIKYNSYFQRNEINLLEQAINSLKSLKPFNTFKNRNEQIKSRSQRRNNNSYNRNHIQFTAVSNVLHQEEDGEETSQMYL